jgi:2,3-diaminopropionate biosynthesis protein SbnA
MAGREADPPAGKGILSAIGRTPLVLLERYLENRNISLFAKLESFNPGGSSKDRPAFEIVESALRSGIVGPGTLIIESSSGNMGIGLAQVCRYHGLRFLCVVDPKASPANLKVLAAYGAEIDCITSPDPISGEWLPARLSRVQALLLAIPGSFWPNQYANEANSGSHYRTTMAEIVRQLDGELDYLFVGTSTCGTLKGCGEFVRDRQLKTRIVAVDAAGSLIFDQPGMRSGARRIPGLGAGIRPPLCDPSVVEMVVHVSDADCVRSCRRLLEREAILAGGSSGGVLAAVERLCDQLPKGSVCAAILPDRGERYLDTIYNDDWVREVLGDIEAPPGGDRLAAGWAAASRV